ncbi:hypothetical protein SAMD00019534_069850 [Acytostelium subglobosum LB1]|uniref:hypothetical protein n=1 Tax=Acytostelium subglobosum LB1 TaxID=1410327 RepID=UPI0006449799|nr:hypothetical protein SAMD00019534_069850 [Acytostelium subglobosum LB1]GAM23810.1 hypothetical protein SAMD00019534_069850 [Acytostelium subglobosum LB1]|eukprot:XP_012753551.1 hypothetical protein SAMD00019534_069850 [Acytostelium subglobosum LB1]
MSEEGAKHRDEYRYRCAPCNIDFCVGCNITPYHYNFNCADYKQYLEAKKCRFCKESLHGVTLNSDVAPGHVNVCQSPECQEKMSLSCGKVLPCGHNCLGVHGERTCPPCFKQKCHPKKIKVPSSNDYCNICYVEDLSCAPCLLLECGHAFHSQCIKSRLQPKQSGPRLSFKHLDCPLCNRQMKHVQLKELTAESIRLRDIVQAKASQRLIFEGLNKTKELECKSSKWYRNPEGYAMHHYSYYMCFKCRNPYFAGQVRCEQDQAYDDFNPEELICGSCKGENFQQCNIHGWDFMEFKCHFCCSIAQWYCWGKVHFCDDCHTKQQKGDYLTKKPKNMIPECPGIEKCPLKIAHPHCEEFILGCTICKNIKDF